MKNVEPQKEHLWLKQLVGNWTSEMVAPAGPDQPPQTYRGTEAGRTIGDVWVLLEGKGPGMDGSTATTLFQLGYDTTRKTFVGSFIGSMMTHLWVYDSGELDEAGKVNEEIAEAYGLETAGGESVVREAEKIPTRRERNGYLISCWLETLCTAEIRVLGWVYQELYKKPFAP